MYLHTHLCPCMSAYIHVYICIHTHVCMQACMYVICLCMYIYWCLSLYTHVCLLIYVPKCIHWYSIYVYTYRQTSINTFIHAYIDIYMCVICVHTCMPMHGCLQTCIHICVYIYIYTCIYHSHINFVSPEQKPTGFLLCICWQNGPQGLTWMDILVGWNTSVWCIRSPFCVRPWGRGTWDATVGSCVKSTDWEWMDTVVQ